ncbi:hypothetical protein V2J09_013176 [Rumex salicifolius]
MFKIPYTKITWRTLSSSQSRCLLRKICYVMEAVYCLLQLTLASIDNLQYLSLARLVVFFSINKLSHLIQNLTVSNLVRDDKLLVYSTKFFFDHSLMCWFPIRIFPIKQPT